MTEEMEEKARAEAEARRQRILDGADNRMDRVSGLNADEEGDKPASKSSKLAAMRRRRFKKKSADEKPAESKADEEGKPADESKTAAKEEPKETPGETKEQQPKAEEKEAEVIEEVNTPGVQKEEKKKYMGVAKMRRKMLQEKKKNQTSEAGEEPAVVLKKKSKKTSAQRTADKVAIIMHVIIVFLLFFAGLDVGLQKKLDYGSDVVVQTGLAPRETKFLNLIPSFIRPKDDAQSVVEPKLGLEEVVAEDVPPAVVEDTDEFGQEEKPHLAEEKNMDPLFQVDLDEYTRGPGIYMACARFAVFLHRCNLSLFYYGPKRVFTGMANMLNSFVAVPPLLAIIALVLRQLIGNTILGAHLPVETVEDDKKNDIMSAVFNMVKNFLSGMFPNAIGLYKGWTLLRADMYVVVCGLMVGLAWQHSQLVPPAETPGRDEL